MNSDDRPILLVQLPIPPPGPEPIRGNVPLAAAYLKLFARRRGLEDRFTIELLPPALCNTLGDQGLVEEILGRQPWMVGFTCYLWNIQRTLWIAEQLKRRQPQLQVLLGGPEITPDNAWCSIRQQSTMPSSAKASRPSPNCSTPWTRPGAGGAIAGLWTARRGGPARRVTNPLADLDAVSLAVSRRHSRCGRRAGHAAGNGPRLPLPVPLLLLSQEYAARCDSSPPSRSRPTCATPIERHVPEVFLLDPTLNQRADFPDFLRGLARPTPEGRWPSPANCGARGSAPRRPG